jgi:hypothetical protein
MIAILCLSVVLYSRCFKLLLSLRRSSKQYDLGARPRKRELPLLRRHAGGGP